ncbi:MAG: Hpt domain-containing protein, partial [Gammaproteobacteria bacterium]|nr:Hpt domain-containing protein [Gammaproteobacteria bacterium]
MKDLPGEMHIISDTLAMIGLGSQRQLIEAQIEVVKNIVEGNRPAAEEQLLSMAGELLQVEQSLDQMQKRQPLSATQPKSESDVSRDYELDSVLSAVVTATLDDIQKTKNALLEFIKDPSRGENIDLCISLMRESRGALELLGEQRAVAVVDGLLTYLKGYDIVAFMDAGRLDALSQVIVSLEYYLEALGERRSDASSILDFADVQLQELLASMPAEPVAEAAREAVVVDDQSTTAEPPAAPAVAVVAPMPEDTAAASVAESQAVARAVDAAQSPAAVTADAEAAELEFEADETIVTESGPESVPAADGPVAQKAAATQPADTDLDAQPAAIHASPEDARGSSEVESGEPTTSGEVEALKAAAENQLKILSIDDEAVVLKPGSDPEILEIYLEEADEESQNIARLQQDWLLHPEDENAVKNIRRAFHTIKGSGRLVGAMKIGEFAWDFEQLLNRLIDRAIPPSKQIIDAVGEAAQVLPELVTELKTSVTPQADVNYLRGLARALAEFKAEQLMIDHTQRQAVVESPDDRIIDGDVTEWKGIGVGATTQIVPPDKLTAALLEEIEPDTMRVDRDAFEAVKAQAEQSGAGKDSAFDDTLLEQPPKIPRVREMREASETANFTVADFEFDESSVEYTQAIDYAHRTGEETVVEFKDIEAVELEPVQADADEAIKIETIGEDFLGDDFDAAADDEISIEGVQATPATEPEAEAAVDASAEADIPIIEVVEPEVEELVADTPVAEAEAETETAVASPQQVELAEVEEIVMQTPETEGAGMTLEANDLQSSADSASAPATSASESLRDEARSAAASGQASEQENPPDPLVDTTGNQVPGEEVEAGESRGQEPAAATGLSFDPELLIIYQQEVEQHLSIVSSALDHAEQIKELIPSEEIYRALHTIHGASRTADIATIGELSGLMEKPLKAAVAQKMALDHEIVALYRQGQYALQSMTDELVATRQLPEIPEDLGVSFKALAEDFEEHTVEIPGDEAGPTGEFIDTLTMMTEAVDAEQDNELLTIFVDEANELLEMSDNTLHEWAQQRTDDSGAMDYNAVMELQRYLHTLKGGARMAEINEISDL